MNIDACAVLPLLQEPVIMADVPASQPAPQRKRLALKPRDPEAAARLEAERQAQLASKVRCVLLASGQARRSRAALGGGGAYD